MFYISEGIPFKKVKFKSVKCKVLANLIVSPNAEMMAIEFHQMKRKWLLLGIYKPPIESVSEFT